MLGLFKYADFFRGTAYGALGETFQPWSLILPLGISFFVFQKISYLIDLRRGDRHIYGFLDFCMFVTFFPQLIAGPIVRHNEIIHQFRLDPRRPAMWENLSRGFVLFVIGVAKKVALADTLAMVADPLFGKAVAASLSATEAWVATGAYTLQIYFDFSGYSDMAIGLALMFGLRLPMNFNSPYRAVSIRDFWRRWHITLSRFLRDYLYIPLGGNRCGALRQASNVIVTMLLGGLWHGANWTFVVWGGLHGTALAVNHVWQGSGPAPAERRRLGADTAVRHGLLGAVPLGRFHHRGRSAVVDDRPARVGRVSLDREFVAALIGGAVVALLGPTSQEVAVAKSAERNSTQHAMTNSSVSAQATARGRRRPLPCQTWFTASAAPCSPPQATKVQVAPCHSPPSSMVTMTFTAWRTRAAAVAAERDVEVVAQEARQRHVPAPPEVADRHGAVGRVEVERQPQAEHQREADRHVGVAGEVEIDLQRVGAGGDPGLGRGQRRRRPPWRTADRPPSPACRPAPPSWRRRSRTARSRATGSPTSPAGADRGGTGG